MLKLVAFIFLFGACRCCAEIEFSVGKYSLRGFEICARLEKLSQQGLLGNGMFAAPAMIPYESASDKRGEITHFKFLFRNGNPVVAVYVKTREIPFVGLSDAGNVEFDLKSKSVVSTSFEPCDIQWGQGSGLTFRGETASRRIEVTEYLVEDSALVPPFLGLSACFGEKSIQEQKWLRTLACFNIFRISVKSGNAVLTIAFDKNEHEEFRFVQSLYRAELRPLKSFEESAGADEIILEMQQDVGMHARRIMRFAVKQPRVPAELRRKYFSSAKF